MIVCKLSEEFFRKRSYTRRYDHLASVDWLVCKVNPTHYIIQYHDLVEEVTPDEVKTVVKGSYEV